MLIKNTGASAQELAIDIAKAIRDSLPTNVPNSGCVISNQLAEPDDENTPKIIVGRGNIVTMSTITGNITKKDPPNEFKLTIKKVSFGEEVADLFSRAFDSEIGTIEAILSYDGEWGPSEVVLSKHYIVNSDSEIRYIVEHGKISIPPNAYQAHPETSEHLTQSICNHVIGFLRVHQ